MMSSSWETSKMRSHHDENNVMVANLLDLDMDESPLVDPIQPGNVLDVDIGRQFSSFSVAAAPEHKSRDESQEKKVTKSAASAPSSIFNVNNNKANQCDANSLAFLYLSGKLEPETIENITCENTTDTFEKVTFVAPSKKEVHTSLPCEKQCTVCSSKMICPLGNGNTASDPTDTPSHDLNSNGTPAVNSREELEVGCYKDLINDQLVIKSITFTNSINWLQEFSVKKNVRKPCYSTEPIAAGGFSTKCSFAGLLGNGIGVNKKISKLQSADDCIGKMLNHSADLLSRENHIGLNYIGKLNEHCATFGHKPPYYENGEVVLKGSCISFSTTCTYLKYRETGSGLSKKQAKHDAAFKLYTKLMIDVPEQMKL